MSSSGTHDDAGDLVVLRGGPHDDVHVRIGAPWLEPDHFPNGKYVRTDEQQDGQDVWEWEPR